MQWPSIELYDGKLEAADAVKHHLLCDLPHISKTDLTRLPLLMIDTAGTV